MAYNLRKFEKKLKGLAKILAEVLKLEVEIADSEFYRIAGTGKLSNKVGKFMGKEAHSYRIAVNSKKAQIIMDARMDKICLSCPNLSTCKETSEISYPIVINNQTCGVIGFCCYTQAQRKRLHSNIDNYLKFLETITDLIALDINNDIEQESQMLLTSMLYTVLDRVDYGIVVLNAKNKVVIHNKKLVEMLGEPVTNAAISIDSESDDYGIAGTSESVLKTDKATYRVLSKTYNSSIKEFSAIMFIYNCVKIRDYSKKHIRSHKGVNLIIGKSVSINNLKTNILNISKTRNNILITGEHGTEISLVAKILYEESNEHIKYFEFNCKTVPPSDLDKLLFDTNGIIKKSKSGWLVIKNYECLSEFSQEKLVEILSSKVYSSKRYVYSKNYPQRFVFTSNYNAKELLDKNKISVEFYYLIIAQQIIIPPLRLRSHDIIKEFYYLLKRQLYYLPNRNIKLSKRAEKILLAYSWPGNILELNNVVTYLTKEKLQNQIIDEANLPTNIVSSYKNEEPSVSSLAKTEKDLIIEGLDIYGNTLLAKKTLAKDIGISISTLYRKMKEYNIEK